MRAAGNGGERRLRARTVRTIGAFGLTLLFVEFLDELVYGAREAAWPVIQAGLHLTYDQIGILIGLPNVIGSLIEPWIGIMGDTPMRRGLILGGGFAFTLAMLLIGSSTGFWVLFLALVIASPASGAFVSLSQAALMDTDPARHEHNMARWTFAGSLGVVVGGLVVSLIAAVHVDWRWLFLSFALLAALAVLVARRFPFPAPSHAEGGWQGLRQGATEALRALRRGEVLRWLALLEFSDLMLDVLYGFLALYFANVVGVAPEIAALAVTVWTVVGLVGDFLLIPLLERVRGLSYLRLSAALMFVLYPAFLVVPGLWAKLVLLALLGLFNSGWYSILKGQLYSAMPGRSGTVMTVGNVFDLVGGLVPVAIGVVAEGFGLGAAMWVLLLGPVALLVGIPRRRA